EQDDKGWDARKRAYCLKIQPATGSFARNLIYSTKPCASQRYAFKLRITVFITRRSLSLFQVEVF
ncbi:hypothetical protein, partial [Klebsiella pneumoniae]|uniref:hypothetical protein n=1 Tax=Klebsiella pneumoniae TaxID=573 RepID=UPI0021E72D3B